MLLQMTKFPRASPATIINAHEIWSAVMSNGSRYMQPRSRSFFERLPSLPHGRDQTAKNEFFTCPLNGDFAIARKSLFLVMLECQGKVWTIRSSCRSREWSKLFLGIPALP